MTACIQSVTMFGSELWWKGGHTRGAIVQANELRVTALVGRKVRATTGCFRTTNLGALRWNLDSKQQQRSWNQAAAVRALASQSATGRSGEEVS